jgi:hypothetical protein
MKMNIFHVIRRGLDGGLLQENRLPPCAAEDAVLRQNTQEFCRQLFAEKQNQAQQFSRMQPGFS